MSLKVLTRRFGRRSFLAGLGAASALPILAACTPEVIEVERVQVVEKEVPVERIVTQIVREEVQKVVTVEVEKQVEVEKVITVQVEKAVQIEVEKVITVQVEKQVEVEKAVTVEVERRVEVEVEVTRVVEREVMMPGAMRPLSGKLWFMDRGSKALAGQRPSSRQNALAAAMTQYKVFHPEVEVELTDVPPTSWSAWGPAMYAAREAPDIIHVDAEPGSASVGAVLSGTEQEVLNFYDYLDEPNPYSGGRPWRKDWVDDNLLFSRGNSDVDKYWVHIHNQMLIRTVFTNVPLAEQYGVKDGDLSALSYTEAYDVFSQMEADDIQAWQGYWQGVLPMEQMLIALGHGLWLEGGGHPDNPGEHLFPLKQTFTNWCNGTWIYGKPEMEEAWMQVKRFLESFRGGTAGFYASIPQGYIHGGRGQGWLNGKAAFWMASTVEFNQIRAAEEEGVLGVEEFAFGRTPSLKQEDLFNDSLKIYFDGRFHNWQGGFNQFLATNGTYRRSGPNEATNDTIRDFLQFMTSIHGARVVIENGDVPENPDVMELMDPRLIQAFQVRHPSIQHRGNRYFGLGGYDGASSVGGNLEGFLLGELSYEDFADKVDTIGRRESVEWYSDVGPKRGYEPLDASCEQHGATYLE